MNKKKVPELIVALEIKIKKGLVPLEPMLDLIHEEAQCETTISTVGEHYCICIHKAVDMDEAEEATKLLRHVATLIKHLILLYAISSDCKKSAQ